MFIICNYFNIRKLFYIYILHLIYILYLKNHIIRYKIWSNIKFVVFSAWRRTYHNRTIKLWQSASITNGSDRLLTNGWIWRSSKQFKEYEELLNSIGSALGNISSNIAHRQSMPLRVFIRFHFFYLCTYYNINNCNNNNNYDSVVESIY